jgi:nitrite reductase (NO-forming)
MVIASSLSATMLTGCAAPDASVLASTQIVADGMSALHGQSTTCGGTRHKTFALEARETTVDLGLSTRFEAWTFDGHLPAPTLEACESDRVTITVKNHASTSHGLDSHAFRASVHDFGPVTPQGTLNIDTVVDTPGVFMYHCAAGDVTDVHVKSGLAGAMIVYPRSEVLRPARELVVVQSAVYGVADSDGVIPGTDPTRARKNDPELIMFNGRLEHQDIRVAPEDLVRVYFVNVGPGTSSVHVMGTILDRVTDGRQRIEGVQTYGVPAGGGAIVEFRIPNNGSFGLVDHDRLGYLPFGLMLMFSTGHDGHDHQGSGD